MIRLTFKKIIKKTFEDKFLEDLIPDRLRIIQKNIYRY